MLQRFNRRQQFSIYAALLTVATGIVFLTTIAAGSHKRGSNAIGYAYWNADIASRKFADNPNDPVAIRSMVIQAGLRGDRKMEVFYLEKLQKLNPDDRPMMYRLAYRLVETHHKDSVKQGIALFRLLSAKNDGLGKNSKKIVEDFDRHTLRQGAFPRSPN